MPSITVDGRERSYLRDASKRLQPGARLVLVCHDWPTHLEDPKRSLAEEILRFFEKHGS